MSWLEPIVPERMTEQQVALYRAITAGPRSRHAPDKGRIAPDGSLRGPFNAWMYSPVVGDALQNLGAALRFGSGLPDRLREMTILRVAARRGSDYEWQAHEPLAARAGVTSEELAALAADGPLSLDDPAEAAALRLVDALLGGAAGEQAHRSAAGVLLPAEMVELSTLVAYYSLLAAQMALFGVSP